MSSFSINGVDLFDPLNGKMEWIKEYFVKYYGEQYRDRIEEKIDNTILLFYGSTNAKSFTRSIHKYYNNQRKLIAKSFMRKYYPKYDENASYKEIDFSDLQGICQRIIDKKASHEEIIDLAKLLGFGNKLSDPQISDKGKDKACNKLLKNKNFSRQVQDMVDRWQGLGWKQQYSNIDEEENAFQLRLKKYDNSEKRIYDQGRRQRQEVVARLLMRHTGLSKQEIFDKDHREYIGLCADYALKRKEFISDYDKARFIKLFNFLGFNLGEDFDQYANCQDLQKLFKTSQLKSRLESIDRRMYRRILMNNPFFARGLQKLLKNEVVDINNCAAILSNYVFSSGCGACAMAAKKRNGQSVGICFFPMAVNIDTETVIHELNHVLSMEVDENSKEDDAARVKLGFDTLIMNLEADPLDLNLLGKKGKGNRSKRVYEGFEEAVNTYIARQIANDMESNSIKLGLGDEIECMYNNAVDMLEPFLRKNVDKIKHYRMNGECSKFVKEVGFGVFNSLAEFTNTLMDDDYNQIKQEIQSLCRQSSMDKYEMIDSLTKSNSRINHFKGCLKTRQYCYVLKIIYRFCDKHAKAEKTKNSGVIIDEAAVSMAKIKGFDDIERE